MSQETFATNLLTATQWIECQMVQIDSDILFEIDSEFLIEDNVNLPILGDDSESIDYDFHQCFITNLTDDYVKFLSEHFDLSFAYHHTLEKWIFLVYSSGTSWSYTYCETDLEQAARELGYNKANVFVG